MFVGLEFSEFEVLSIEYSNSWRFVCIRNLNIVIKLVQYLFVF